MFTRLRRTRRLRRARDGGSALKDLRWWQTLTRTQFHLDPHQGETLDAQYTVDVRYLAAELEGGKIAEGARHAHRPVPRRGQQYIANPPVALPFRAG